MTEGVVCFYYSGLLLFHTNQGYQMFTRKRNRNEFIKLFKLKHLRKLKTEEKMSLPTPRSNFPVCLLKNSKQTWVGRKVILSIGNWFILCVACGRRKFRNLSFFIVLRSTLLYTMSNTCWVFVFLRNASFHFSIFYLMWEM